MSSLISVHFYLQHRSKNKTNVKIIHLKRQKQIFVNLLVCKKCKIKIHIKLNISNTSTRKCIIHHYFSISLDNIELKDINIQGNIINN